MQPAESSFEATKPLEASSTTVKVAISDHHRHPSIKFFGKEGWAKKKSGVIETSTKLSTSSIGTAASPVTSKIPNPSKTGPTLVLYENSINPMFGRPKFTDEEMEALILGGASIAPQVLRHSRGAKFKAM